MLKVEHLFKSYQTGRTKYEVLKDVSFEVEEGEFVAVMVTHDSFSASYCDRVIVMKDGKIFTELVRKGGRREFLDELLTVLKDLNGGE